MAPRWYIYVAVAIGGACGLAVEMLGTRLLAPYYGASLYLWSALIAATLLALGLGYFLGGRWADRAPRLHRFCLLFAAAGVWIAAIPWLRHPILAATEPLGLRAAVLLASAVLFMPPLTLLGMATPYAVRLATTSLDVIGRVSGRLYALSTVAGMIAALGTAFLLVPVEGPARLTFDVGVLLVVTALVGAAIVRRTAAIAIVLIAAAVALGASIDPGERPRPESGFLAIEHTPYSEIRVVTKDELRLMLIDGMIHTEIDTVSFGSPSDYVNVLDLAGRMFREPGRMLLVGLGGGAVARRYARNGWSVDAVEIDPAITRIAREYFGLAPADARVFHMDGREFLSSGSDRYDLIVIDVFGSGALPFHLVTREAFALFKRRLAPGGVIAMNAIAVGWQDDLVRSLSATMNGELSRVIVLPMAEPPNQLGNVIIVASDREPDLVEELPVPFDRFSPEYHRAHAWDNRFTVDPRGVRVITDDRNPSDLWAEHVNLEVRKGLHEYFGPRGFEW